MEAKIMLPQFLYNALPYIYLVAGAWSALSISNTLAFMSGAIFGATAIYVFAMRGTFARN
tara:strand:+ start:4210 stop:4389 length:180 start_codon:yes stop_codon:yes gene_type:complete